jgi:hypothetical protein
MKKQVLPFAALEGRRFAQDDNPGYLLRPAQSPTWTKVYCHWLAGAASLTDHFQSPQEPTMTKPLDQQLADLSVRAKKAEDAINSARKETRDRVVARREEFRAAAADAADRVDKDLRSAGASMEGDWTALRGKVAADIDRLKSKVADRQVELNASRLADRASRKESEACVAIDFAVASIENAKLAVLDADREAAGAQPA